MTKLDWNKPLRTKSGRSARKATDNSTNNLYPYGVIIEREAGDEYFLYTKDGTIDKFRDSVMDLENVPEKIVRYVNVFTDGSSPLYKARSDANNKASRNRIACIRVEFEEGQYDD